MALKSPPLLCLLASLFISACSSQDENSWLKQSLQNGANSSASFFPVNEGGATGQETWEDQSSASCKENFIGGSCF